MKIKFPDTGQIIEVTEHSQLANTKVRVTPETSRQIQEEVLPLGVKWINGRSEVLWTESPFLFFMPDFGKVALSHLPKRNGNRFKRSYCREFILLPSLSSPSELQDSKTPAWVRELKKVEQLPQTQEALNDQLDKLRVIANNFGLYDAADYCRTSTSLNPS